MESSDGDEWDEYEGRDANRLLRWLEQGNLQAEKPLICILASAPLPPWTERQPTDEAPAEKEEKPEVLDADEEKPVNEEPNGANTQHPPVSLVSPPVPFLPFLFPIFARPPLSPSTKLFRVL